MDYKRLTERRGGLVIDKCGNCENVSNPMGCTESMCYEIMKNRLAELEDKIEQGTLKEEKIGKWLLEKTPDGKPYCFHCSVCDSDFKQISNKTKTDYCPDCGAKMQN